MDSQFSKLSVITVVYNAVHLIEGTIQSVIRQDYPNIEYIVIDGHSNDGTLSILEKYADKIDILVSEPDKGLYDAMNKGLDKATGEYVWFMNAGDWIHDAKTVSRIFQSASGSDIYYGECMFVDGKRNHLGLRSKKTPHHLPEELTWQNMARGMVVSHQSFIVRKKIISHYIGNNLCADIDWVIKALKNADKITNTQLILSEFLIGGLSKQRHRESLGNRYSVLKNHFGLIPNIFNHMFIVLRAVYYKIKG